jgi:hypothetical protein
MKRKSALRNQYGMAKWVKIILCLFATGLLIAVVSSILLIGFFRDMMDPKKTEEVANKIVTLVHPLPPPFEYGHGNISMFGYSGALISNTDSQALFILGQLPKKDADTGAQKFIDEVASESASNSAVGGSKAPTASAANSAAGGSKAPTGATGIKTTMKVETQGALDVGGTKLYYLMGKASSAKDLSSSTSTGQAQPTSVETFVGAADSKDSKEITIIIVQQAETGKHLSMDEVEAFTNCIKAF